MNEERLKQIGKFLETRMFIHRQVEHNSPWTTEEKMIVELYDSYITLLMEYSVYYKKQKEVIDKLENKIKVVKQYNFDRVGRYELLDILKEVKE